MVRAMGGILRRNRWRTLLWLAAVLAGCGIWLLPREPAWLQWLAACRRAPGVEGVNRLAWFLSEYGDFLGFNALTFAGLYLAAAARRSRFLRLLLASLLGTTFSGGTANVLRALLGRARPNAKCAPGFHGPSLSASRHSCPSGHSATAFGGSIPVLVAYPPLGVPLMLTAGAVAWSRFHNRVHHPSDVLLSLALAAVYGVPLGLAARRLARRGASGGLPQEDEFDAAHAGGIEAGDGASLQPGMRVQQGVDERALIA